MKTLAIALVALALGTAVWASPSTAPTQLAALVSAANAQDEQMPWHFGKYYIRYIPRELVWFNGREGDLEHHAVRRGGNVYITLTDLIRHLSGSVVWGPSASFVEVKRGGTTVRFVPGSAKVVINGDAKSLGAASFRRDRLLWVPVQPVAALFGAKSEWKAGPRHLDVTFE